MLSKSEVTKGYTVFRTSLESRDFSVVYSFVRKSEQLTSIFQPKGLTPIIPAMTSLPDQSPLQVCIRTRGKEEYEKKYVVIFFIDFIKKAMNCF